MMQEMWKNEWSTSGYILEMWMWPVGLIAAVALVAFFVGGGRSGSHKK